MMSHSSGYLLCLNDSLINEYSWSILESREGADNKEFADTSIPISISNTSYGSSTTLMFKTLFYILRLIKDPRKYQKIANKITKQFIP